MAPRPPRLAKWLIRLLPIYRKKHRIDDDLEECFLKIIREEGERPARRWYWGQCLGAVPAQVLGFARWSGVMFQNYGKVAVRSLIRHKVTSAINLAGFAVGMAAGILIFLWVGNELSYDRFHENAGRVFRVDTEYEEGRGFPPGAVTSALLAPTLKDAYPEIDRTVRLYRNLGATVRSGGTAFIEDRFFFVDADFFDVFSFGLLNGDPKTVLRDPSSLVLTRSAGAKLFGRADPRGKTVTVLGRGDFRITGVVEDCPANSHFHFDFLAPFAALGPVDNPWTYQGWTYIVLSERSDPALLEAKFQADREKLGWYSKGLRFRLQPLTSIHLRSHKLGEIEDNGDIRLIFIFSTIAVLVLLIAAVNFINLSTARSAARAREVGLRKVVGATRRQLVRQFLGESLVLTLLAFVAAIVLAGGFLPFFHRLAGTAFAFAPWKDPKSVVLLLGIVVVVSLAAGGYPAFLISAVRPAETFRRPMPRASGRRALRRVLVAGQFAVSLVLMIMTGIVASQLGYVQRKDLGFRKDDILEIPIAGTPLAKSCAAFRDELRSSSGILGVSVAMGSPLHGRLVDKVTLGSEEVEVKYYPVDEEYLETLGIPLIRGRNFSRSFPSDASAAVIVNESAVRAFGLDDPLGKPFKKLRGNGAIIGVVKDFHSASLREPVSPAVFEILPSFYRNVLVRVSPRDVSATLETIGRVWKKFAPQHPFSYVFLDDAYGRLYQSEDRFLKVFLGFSGLALFIAGLGLYGLASLAVAQRTKEIGIRKALGASISKVVVLFSGEFLRLIFLAGLAATPVAWSLARAWLRPFAFQTKISPWIFIGSTALALGVGILTVGAQSVRAASVDPAQTLKYE